MTKINAWGSDDPASVSRGFSGRGSQIAYSVLCGGTTTTSAQQSIASVGSSGQILTSTGAGSLPSFQTAAGGGSADWTLITSIDCSSGGAKTVTSGLGTAYDEYRFVINFTSGASSGTSTLSFSDDGGSTYAVEIQGLRTEDGLTSATYSTSDIISPSVSASRSLVGYFHFTGNKSSINKDIIGIMSESSPLRTIIWESRVFIGSMITTLDIDALKFVNNGGDFDGGSATIYGR